MQYRQIILIIYISISVIRLSQRDKKFNFTFHKIFMYTFYYFVYFNEWHAGGSHLWTKENMIDDDLVICVSIFHNM